MTTIPDELITQLRAVVEWQPRAAQQMEMAASNATWHLARIAELENFMTLQKGFNAVLCLHLPGTVRTGSNPDEGQVPESLDTA